MRKNKKKFLDYIFIIAKILLFPLVIIALILRAYDITVDFIKNKFFKSKKKYTESDEWPI